MIPSKSIMRTHSNDLFSGGLHLVYVNFGYELLSLVSSGSR